ncbi:ubiquitin-conjugating enzyme/RWD-like protein [Scleroderma yunnanense]
MPPALSSTMTMKRIHREIADVKKEDLGAITLTPTPDSLYRWKGTIPGPQGSPYEGGLFNVDIQLGADYPFSAPKVTFATRIYHMNISEKGGICIDILKQNWSPALSLFKVMLSLSSLLTDPNPQDPLVPSIATEYMRNRQQHDRTARRWTELYAQPPPIPAPAASTSGRSKGKERATIVPALQTQTSTTRSGSTASIRLTSRPEAITIDDSDAGVVATSSRVSVLGRKRQRDVDTIDLVEEEERAQRKRLSTNEVIVIDD